MASSSKSVTQTTVIQQSAPSQPVYCSPVVYATPYVAAPVYAEESYCGVISLIIGIFLFPCIICCPVDKRTVS